MSDRENFLRNHDENVRVMRVAQKRAEDAGSADAIDIERIADAWMEIGNVIKSGEPVGFDFAQKACAYSAQVIERNIQEIDRLRSHKAALLEACKAAVKAFGGTCDIKDCDQCKAYELCRAAITLTEENQT